MDRRRIVQSHRGSEQDVIKVVLENHTFHKRELDDLNDLLARYIKKVRDLEKQHHQRIEQLRVVKRDVEIVARTKKREYEDNLLALMKKNEKASTEKLKAETNCSVVVSEVHRIQNRYNELSTLHVKEVLQLHQLKAAAPAKDSELAMIQDEVDQQHKNIDDLQKQVKKLDKSLADGKREYDRLSGENIKFNVQKDGLEKRVLMMDTVQKAMLDVLMTQFRVMTVDKSSFTVELESAVKDIRTEFSRSLEKGLEREEKYKTEIETLKTLLDVSGGELESKPRRQKREAGGLYAEIKVISSTNRDLEVEVSRLEMEVELQQKTFSGNIRGKDDVISRLQKDIATLYMQNKVLLDGGWMPDAEVITYRKLIGGEAGKPPPPVIKQVVKRQQTLTKRSLRKEIKAKGVINIEDADPDGTFIVLKNTSQNKEVDLFQWKLKRDMDGRETKTVMLPPGISLKPGQETGFWPEHCGGKHDPPVDYILDGFDSWGIGNNIITELIDPKEEVRAQLIQRPM